MPSSPLGTAPFPTSTPAHPTSNASPPPAASPPPPTPTSPPPASPTPPASSKSRRHLHHYDLLLQTHLQQPLLLYHHNSVPASTPKSPSPHSSWNSPHVLFVRNPPPEQMGTTRSPPSRSSSDGDSINEIDGRHSHRGYCNTCNFESTFFML
ncbi:Apoptosis regulator [Forsythia ovata]|uniref:Apoptosis regulator n=1 Tax=Forsythia ovata TaxID=205694 RepID=A0ABD1RLL8_9LAMI